MKKLFALAFLFASPAFAEVGGYVNGGLSIGSYQNEFSDSEEGIELDTGTGFNITGGLRFSPGFEARLSYMQTNHDGGDFTDDGDFDGEFDEEVTLSDFRAGVF
ncbi:MAG TPA: outer membrane beta-barrel protein, partial [Steroidobacteraceae bacterium]|nr:outer membrane beta-barrel protein [Steroidobacteraceae bacterium]